MSKIKINKKNKDSFLEFLKGITLKYDLSYIEISFDGAGDSGEIGNIIAYNKEEQVEIIDFQKEEYDVLRDFSEYWLSEQNYDWYNNDGGWGTINLYPDGSIKCDMNIRIQSHESFSLEDDEFSKNYKIVR